MAVGAGHVTRADIIVISYGRRVTCDSCERNRPDSTTGDNRLGRIAGRVEVAREEYFPCVVVKFNTAPSFRSVGNLGGSASSNRALVTSVPARSSRNALVAVMAAKSIKRMR